MTLISAERVRVEIPDSPPLVLIDDVSLAVAPGEFVAIVGESGAGKTTLATALLQHLRPPARMTAGEIREKGTARHTEDVAGGRVRIGYIVSNPASHLDPLQRIGDQVAQAYRYHQKLPKRESRTRAAEALRAMRIADVDRLMRAYPHQISGGMAQRVLIAMALATDPELLIADEPVTGLDVTLQRDVLDEIVRQGRATGAAVIFVTHDLGLAAAYCSRVVVMYSGRIVEDAPTAEFFERPRHPYSAQLVAAVAGDTTASARDRRRDGAAHLCPYLPFCPVAFDRCSVAMPDLVAVGRRAVRCHHEDERGAPA
ncbi:MAG: peptide/nickel transport system ATP-binding protein [Solirubrobacteraceae bacterium]|jgi:ABC-type dipeptide/oligopeptide/nickel transport system ATPase component|nr:peptide/nickel transport system ATP-binding protein [Solirubrobacteraceae bacterium]